LWSSFLVVKLHSGKASKNHMISFQSVRIFQAKISLAAQDHFFAYFL
jgi:hypothetical protein